MNGEFDEFEKRPAGGGREPGNKRDSRPCCTRGWRPRIRLKNYLPHCIIIDGESESVNMRPRIRKKGMIVCRHHKIL